MSVQSDHSMCYNYILTMDDVCEHTQTALLYHSNNIDSVIKWNLNKCDNQYSDSNNRLSNLLHGLEGHMNDLFVPYIFSAGTHQQAALIESNNY